MSVSGEKAPNNSGEVGSARLIGDSAEMTAVRALIDKVAAADSASVLILGESGTGKELVAQEVHERSRRSSRPFVPVNCGAIPDELLESELFGHEKGAFTGALTRRRGRFELADGGTLFLDEIGDMPMAMQVKLLRVLQERCFERVGGNQTLACDVRVIAATHRDIEERISEGLFREDLYYRLNVFPIYMPALRERLGDVPQLVEHFKTRLPDPVEFGESALVSLQAYDWPGNVRELGNLVERMGIMQPDRPVQREDLPERYQQGPVVEVTSERHADVDSPVEAAPEQASAPDSSHTALSDTALSAGELGSLLGTTSGEVSQEAPSAPDNQLEPDYDARPDLRPVATTEQAVEAGAMPILPPEGLDLKQYLANVEVSLVEQALRQTDGVVARSAELLGLRRTTLVEKIKKHGIDLETD